MKNLKVLGCALLLLIGILLYWNLYHQEARNDDVIIQQTTEAKPTVAGEKNNTAQQPVENRRTWQDVMQRRLAEKTIAEQKLAQQKLADQSPRTVSNIDTHKDLSIDHDNIEFYDVQPGPDHLFTQSQEITITPDLTINKPLQINDVYQNTDQYSGANRQLDNQLLQNNDLIITQQELMHDLESKYNVIRQKIETTAYHTPYTANRINESIKKINENYEQADNQLQALYDKEGRIMAARKGAYQQNQAALIQKGSSLFKYPTMNIKTKIASPYNKISDMRSSSTLAKANAISFPAAKPVETSSLIEID